MLLYILLVLSLLCLSIGFSYYRSAQLYARSVAMLLDQSRDIAKDSVTIKKYLLDRDSNLIGPLNMAGYGGGLAACIWLFTMEWYYPLLYILITGIWLTIMPTFKKVWIPKLRRNIDIWQVQMGVELPAAELNKIGN